MQSVLEQSEVIARAYEYVRRFLQILTERDETALPLWACATEASQIPELVRFGKTAASGLGSERSMRCCLPPAKGRSKAR